MMYRYLVLVNTKLKTSDSAHFDLALKVNKIILRNNCVMNIL